MCIYYYQVAHFLKSVSFINYQIDKANKKCFYLNYYNLAIMETFCCMFVEKEKTLLKYFRQIS